MNAINWVDKTMWTNDNLLVMRGMNSDSVDLIYLDPPFNSNADYSAPIGSKAAGVAFKDTWSLQDVDIAWLDLIEAKHPKLNQVINAAITKSDMSYLIYMAVRLLEMKRILKPTGSIYLHCDPTMSSYLRLVMDAVFGYKNYRTEIVWQRRYGRAKGSQHLPKSWGTHNDIILFYVAGSNVRIKPCRKIDPDTGVGVGNLWLDIKPPKGDELTGYPTQKPLALLDRIIRASSNEGDIVFDPFCGCATAMVAADRLNRNWVGIDISSKAVELFIDRIKADQGMFKQIIPRTDIPARTDLGSIGLYNALANKRKLYGEQEGNCNGCGTRFPIQNLEVDHIIARTIGGTDHIDNLQLLCSSCNRIKGNRGQEYLIAKLEGKKTERYWKL